MGMAVSYIWKEELFEEVLEMVNYVLSIESLHEEPRTVLRRYFKDGEDLYYSAPTGHGKSPRGSGNTCYFKCVLPVLPFYQATF